MRAGSGLRLARTTSWRHPLGLLALKTAVAAVLAWLLVQPLGGFTDDYPYYAPLGALVGMSTTVAGSLRTAVQAVAAIFMGTVTAFAVRAIPLPEPVAIGVAIGLATLMTRWRRLGPMAGWVPFAALFVLIVGEGDPVGYALAYGGLTALGAAVGVAVNLTIPQLPLTPAVLASGRLRGELADQLDRLADGLEAEQVLDRDDWDRLRMDLQTQSRSVEDLVAHALDARRGNWRARRWDELAEHRYAQARALQRLTRCVDEVITVVADERAEVHAAGDLAAELRSAIARAFREVVTLLRDVDDNGDSTADPEVDSEVAERARAAVADLRERVSRAIVASGGQDLAAATIAVNLHRAIEEWG